MKMDAYCKDLQEEATKRKFPKQASSMHKKCEAMAGELGGAKMLWWERTKLLEVRLEKKYIYRLEVEQDRR